MTIETGTNPKGLIGLSQIEEDLVVAFPMSSVGHVGVRFLDRNELQTSVEIKACDSSVAHVALNKEGTLLATASEKGTLIRIFDTKTGNLLQEVRRGTKTAEIYSIVFDDNSNFIACTSDTGTVHIFSLANAKKKLEGTQTSTSFFGMLGGYITPKILNDERSFASFYIPNVKSVATFGPDNNIIGK